MKVKMIIENGKTKIVLIPEIDFETDIIEKVFESKKKHDISVEFKADYDFGTYKDFRIEIDVEKKPPINC